jgi:hypothetical protein
MDGKESECVDWMALPPPIKIMVFDYAGMQSYYALAQVCKSFHAVSKKVPRKPFAALLFRLRRALTGLQASYKAQSNWVWLAIKCGEIQTRQPTLPFKTTLPVECYEPYQAEATVEVVALSKAVTAEVPLTEWELSVSFYEMMNALMCWFPQIDPKPQNSYSFRIDVHRKGTGRFVGPAVLVSEV